MEHEGHTVVKKCREGGFTLLELLVVVAILGVIGAVAVLNVGVFLGAGSEESLRAEQHNVQTAVLAYLQDGNVIETEFAVCPGNKGPLAPYLIGDLTQCWIVSLNGSIGIGSLSTLFSSEFDDMAGLLPLMGDWYVEDGVLKPTLTGGEHRIAIVEGGPWQDFSMNVTAQYLTGDYAGGGYGIYYRANGERDITGYVLQFDPGMGNDFVVRKVVDGREQSPFQRVDMASVLGQDWVDNHLNDPHDIQIEVRGDRHVITVDGTEIMNFEDDTFDEGTVGFRSWHSTDVGFDDIEVTE